ncbi:unnamed protein product [Colias eurytheme]|nr:unnamed protein product [Colias eurytheme]
MLLKYRGHFYSKVNNSKYAWRCINTKSCYRTILAGDDLIVARESKPHQHPPAKFLRFIVTINHQKYLQYNGYYYVKDSGSKKRWRCIKTSSCFVSILVDNETFEVVKEPAMHNHLPKNFVRYSELKAITFVNGRTYYMYRGYTFSFGFKTKTKERWRCTHTSECFQYIILDRNHRVVESEANHHTHEPPKLYLMSNGRYVKIK